ncbi:MAG TPA: YlbE-like family protein [Virgibacillus sp.]|nr:YlbE-like family protein [Virgibacillus sp.]
MNHLHLPPDQVLFIRYNPVWYRYLSRDPRRVDELPEITKEFFGRTFSHRIGKLDENIKLVGMLMEFAEMMKD